MFYCDIQPRNPQYSELTKVKKVKSGLPGKSPKLLNFPIYFNLLQKQIIYLLFIYSLFIVDKIQLK